MRNLRTTGVYATLHMRNLRTSGVYATLRVLNKLVDRGNTVIVIEHNMDVIKTADYLIDLGPEGGAGGGTIVATGTPEAVAQHRNSFTGQFLKECLKDEG
jgi:excinuclease ABC subunit A